MQFITIDVYCSFLYYYSYNYTILYTLKLYYIYWISFSVMSIILSVPRIAYLNSNNALLIKTNKYLFSHRTGLHDFKLYVHILSFDDITLVSLFLYYYINYVVNKELRIFHHVPTYFTC